MEPDLQKMYYFTNHKKLTLLFANDQVIIAYLEDNLQRGVVTLQTKQKILEWKNHPKNMRQWHF
jgi:hypothetical protein